MWSIENEQTVDIEEDVTTVKVRLVGGDVDVVSGDGPTRVEVSDVDGPPVEVAVVDGVLTVSQKAEKLARLWRTGCRAHVVVAAPAGARVDVGVVTAAAMVAGFTAKASVSTVSGGVVCDDLTGGVDVNSVSGDLELRGPRGAMSFNTVSGDVTVVSGEPTSLSGQTVSGDVTVDCAPGEGATLRASSVSGAVRFRTSVDGLATARLHSATGSLDVGDLDLEITKRPGHREARLDHGLGTVELTASTVSGSIALLDRA